MADIDFNASLSLTDNITAPLRKISSQISILASTIDKVDVDSALDPKAVNDFRKAAQGLDKTVSELEEDAKSAAAAQKKHNDSLKDGQAQAKNLENNYSGLNSAIGRLAMTYGGLEGIKGITSWADSITQTTSRLNMVNQAFNEINHSQQTTRDLQNQIYKAAQNSRGSYSDLQNLVASLGNNARDAFSSTEELVTFAESLSKVFAISGASAEEMSNATLQLTQGLASGTLRGDELNSVMEQAPELINVIAQSMGVSRGEIRELASEGKITADVVKNALVGSAESIDQKFQGMDTTFSQMWTRFSNMAQHALEPISKYAAGAASSIMAIFSAMQMVAQVNESGGLKSFITGKPAEEKTPKVKKKDSSGGILSNAKNAVSGVSSAIAGIIPDSLIDRVTDSFSSISLSAKDFATSLDRNATNKLLEFSFKVNDYVGSITKAVTSSKAFTNVLTPIGKTAGSVASSVAPLISSLLSFSGKATLIVGGIGLIATALGKLNETGQLSANIRSFFNDFSDKVAEFGSTAVREINGFVAKLPAIIPNLVEHGIGLVKSLIDGISQSLPNILQAASDIIIALVRGLANSLPLIMQGGISLIQGLISSITENLPLIFNSAVTVISEFVTALAENAPLLIQAGLQCLQALIDGFVNNIPQIITAILNLIASIGKTIVENLPTIIEAGIKIIGALLTGIIQALPQIISGTWQALTAIVTTLWENRGEIIKAGWDILKALGEGLINVGGVLWNTLLDVGKNIIEGIKKGVSDAWSGFTGWLNQTFQGIIDSIKDIFGIHSPSSVMQDEVGFNLVEGLKQGISTAWDGLMGVARGLWDGLLSIFGGGQQEEDTQIVDYSAQIEQTKAQLATLQAEVQAGYANILATVQESNAQIVTTGIGMFAQMSGAIISDAGVMVAGINEQLTLIPGMVGAALAAAIPVAQNYFNALSLEAQAQIAGLVDLSQKAFLAILPAFTTVLNSLKSLTIESLTALQSSALAILNSLATDFVNIFKDMVAKVLSILAAFANQAASAMRTVKDKMVSVLATLPATLRSQAVAAMNAFVDGIRSQISSATNVTSELVEAVKATFIKGLGIHSPAKTTYYYGTMTGQGFINGLSDSQLVAFAESVLTEISNAFDGNKFNAGELVAYLGDDTQKVIDYYNEHPELLKNGDSGSQTIAYPLQGGPYPITSYFGHRASPGGIGSTNHGGTDIGAPSGTPILSALEGDVTIAGVYGGYGNAVMVNTPPYDFLYGHMREIATSVGAHVQKGQLIGYVGSTGRSTGPHLHFETRENGSPVPNAELLEGASITAMSSVVQAIQQAYNAFKGIGTGSNVLSGYNYDLNGGAAQWRSTVEQALNILGLPLGSNVDDVLYAIERESSGRPAASNDYDSNAAIGQNSKGLMQVTPATFQEYALPGYNTNIIDPLSNIIAGIRHMIGWYGSISNCVTPRRNGPGGWSGYAKGTSSATPGVHLVGEEGPELVSFNGGEKVFTNRESRAILNKPSGFNSGSVSAPITINMGGVTINNSEEFDRTIDDFESALAQAINRVIFNEPKGYSIGG